MKPIWARSEREHPFSATGSLAGSPYTLRSRKTTFAVSAAATAARAAEGDGDVLLEIGRRIREAKRRRTPAPHSGRRSSGACEPEDRVAFGRWDMDCPAGHRHHFALRSQPLADEPPEEPVRPRDERHHRRTATATP